MSTKSDLFANTTPSPFFKSYSNESLLSKNMQLSAKTNIAPSGIATQTSKTSLPHKITINSDNNQVRANSPSTATMHFASRFLTNSPLRALTIDTNNEGSSYNLLESSRLTSFSATHNPAPQHIHTANSLISSLNGNLSAKYSRANESFRRPAQISPSKSPLDSNSLLSPKPLTTVSFPFSTTHQTSSKVMSTLGNDFARALLSSITPTSLHSKKTTTKSYSQDRNKGTTLYTSFDNKRAITENCSRISVNSGPESSRSFNTSDNPSNNESSDVNLNTIFKSLKGGFGNYLQASIAKKAMTQIPNHEPTKCSVKRNGIVKAYAANTNQGIVRNYNEDRVSIILNIMKPASRVNEEWPKCSFFGVYDGHGGVICADFLRDNLHQYVIKEPSFPWNPKEALMKGFESAEKTFLELAQNSPNGEIDRSGSCALVVLIVGDMCYVANVGDSRAVMSGDGGAKIFPLSKDHKPSDEKEQKRIIEAGGKIYQSQAPVLKKGTNDKNASGQMELLLGPHRVFPGRLSVSRTFGDIEAKLPKYGGNPNVVIAIPEIKTFRVNPEYDFIVLATDGIYDKLTSRDVIKTVWGSTQELATNIHGQCGLAVENILRESINRRTLDNITVVMLCFKNFKQKLFPEEKSKLSEAQSITQDPIASNVSKSSLLGVSMSMSNIICNTEPSPQKDKLNLKEILNEGINVSDKSIIQQKSVPQLLSNNNGPNNSTKRASTSLKEKNPSFSDSQYKKENKAKQLPISDVNLLSKRLLTKRGNEIQKTITVSKSLNQGIVASQKLTEINNEP